MKLKIGENRKKAKETEKTSLCNPFGILLVTSFISATLGYYWAIISSQIVRNLYLPWDFVSGLHHMHITIVPLAFQQTSTPRVACVMWIWFCSSQFVHTKSSSYSVCCTMSYVLCANVAMGCTRWLIDWDQVWAHSHLQYTLAIVFNFVLLYLLCCGLIVQAKNICETFNNV